MDRVRCFLLRPTDIAEEVFRRYSSSSPCPGRLGYHNAETKISRISHPQRSNPIEWVGDGAALAADPRWPTTCAACPFVFDLGDARSHEFRAIYQRSDTDELILLNDAPPGAIWDATWLARKGPDGRALICRLPNGIDWAIDGPSTNGPGWSRIGEPPDLTVLPSIHAMNATPSYHGFLRLGWLEPA